MTDRPILFSDEMIRAILDGRKTQTRRVLMGFHSDYFVRMEGSHAIFNDHILELATGKPHLWSFPGRFGIPGDRLWVREAWKISSFMEGEPVEFQYRADGACAEENDYARAPENTIAYEEWYERVCSKGTDWLYAHKYPENEDGIFTWDRGQSPLPWRPSIFMPRWASRITLEIVSVGVERVNEISVDDARAEGVYREWDGTHHWYGEENSKEGLVRDPRLAYQKLWDKLNASRGFSWEKSPWVWKIEFRRI